MRPLLLLLLASGLWAQGTPPDQTSSGQPSPGQQEVDQLATRILQLMESTAVAVPGLIRASEVLKQNAETTFAAIERTPRSPGREPAALIFQFINQIKAYLALSDSFPRPSPFPAAADRQYAELREGLQRIQQYFDTILQQQNQVEQKRDSDPNSLKRYAEADSRMLPPTKLPRVVFLGDSLTDDWRLNEYFTGRDFINLGIGEQTTLQMLARFRQDVASLNPRVVAILSGTYDIAAGISLNQIEENLTTIADLAKVHGIKPAFASVLPVNDYHKDADPRYERTANRPPEAIQSLNNWMKGFCQSQGLVYMDYYSVMVDSAGRLQSDLSDDGLHPNAKGYRVMSRVALEAIGRVLGELDESQPGKRRFRILK